MVKKVTKTEVAETTVAETQVAEAAPKKAVAKAQPKKSSVKKTPAKKEVKAEKPAKDKSGLRKPQVRILQALAKSNKPLDRKQIAGKASVDQAGLVEYLGSPDDAVRSANDKKHFMSLISLKLVKQEQHDVDGKDVIQYSLTATGRTAVAKL